MVSIIFNENSMNTGQNFMDNFNNSNEVMVITGVNGSGKTKCFEFLQTFLSKNQLFYPISIQSSSDQLKNHSSSYQPFLGSNIEEKLNTYLSSNLNDKKDVIYEKLEKIYVFFNKNPIELKEFEKYLKTAVHLDIRLGEVFEKLKLKPDFKKYKMNYEFNAICDYIKNSIKTQFRNYFFDITPNDLFGPEQIFQYLIKSQYLNEFREFISKNSKHYGFKYNVSESESSLCFRYDENMCSLNGYNIKCLYGRMNNNAWIQSKTYLNIRNQLEGYSQENTSMKYKLKLMNCSEKTIDLRIDNENSDPEYEDLLVLGKNDYTTVKYDKLSSGERFIFLGLLWKFISEKKLEIIDSQKIIYLLDEPDSHLEQIAIEKLLLIIQNDLVKNLKIKVIISTHNINTVNFFEHNQNVFSCELNRKNQFIINSLNYSKSNEMLTNSTYLNFKKGHIKNPCLFDDIILEVYPHQSKAAIGNSMEAVFRVYFQNDKKKRLKFIKDIHFLGDKKSNDLDEDDVEFEETENFNKIDLEKYETKISKNTNKVFILWPCECNPCFDFLVVADKQIGFYQIKISTGIKAKLDETFLGKVKTDKKKCVCKADCKNCKCIRAKSYCTSFCHQGIENLNCTNKPQSIANDAGTSTASIDDTSFNLENNSKNSQSSLEKHYKDIIVNQQNKEYISKSPSSKSPDGKSPDGKSPDGKSPKKNQPLFEKKYKDIIKKQLNEKKYSAKYFYIHGNCEKENENCIDHKYLYEDQKSIIEDDENKPKYVRLYSTDFLGRTIFDSKFMQFFNQFEINIIENFKKTELLKRFLDILEVTESEIATNNHFRVLDINEIDTDLISDKYIVVFQEIIARKTRDFEFFILKNDTLLYFYVTTKEYPNEIININYFNENSLDNQSLNFTNKYGRFLSKFKKLSGTDKYQKYVISDFNPDDKRLMITQDDVKNVSKNQVIFELEIKCKCKTTCGIRTNCTCNKNKLNCTSLCHEGSENPKCTNKRNSEKRKHDNDSNVLQKKQRIKKEDEKEGEERDDDVENEKAQQDDVEDGDDYEDDDDDDDDEEDND
jgi:hypothetical protein